jgi:hypothetical protein
MKYLVIASLFLLTGCISMPTTKHAYPTPPEVLTERCRDLNKIADDEEKLSEFLKIVTKNYTLYYECATKQELLVKWLMEQKAIHDEVFNKGK